MAWAMRRTLASQTTSTAVVTIEVQEDGVTVHTEQVTVDLLLPLASQAQQVKDLAIQRIKAIQNGRQLVSVLQSQPIVAITAGDLA